MRMFALLSFALVACSTDTPPTATTAYFNCGDVPVQGTFYEDKLDLMVNNQLLQFEHVISASGAKYYHAPEESEPLTLVFWEKGEEAVIMRNEELLHECKRVSTSTPTMKGRYRAVGNEPGWVVTVEAGQMDIQTHYGAQKQTVKISKTLPSGKGVRYQAKGAELNIRYDICQDVMSGRYFSDQVTLTLGKDVFKGCGNYVAD